jgi:hypothetical protein
MFCPDTERCYYVDPRNVGPRGIYLRLAPPKNNQRKSIHFASDYTEIPEACGVSAVPSTELVAEPLIRHSREPRSHWGFARAHNSAG